LEACLNFDEKSKGKWIQKQDFNQSQKGKKEKKGTDRLGAEKGKNLNLENFFSPSFV
jgi:hypothetical protein